MDGPWRDTHALICLHTFCKYCIDQLDSWGKVVCPQCRQMCQIDKIKKDFKTQTLIDSYNATEETEVPDYAGFLCGMCEDDEQSWVSHCEKCKHFMCAKCQLIHNRIQATRLHQVKPLNEVLENLNVVYDEPIRKLRHIQHDFDHHLADIKSVISQIKKEQEDQIQQTDKCIEKIRLDLHHKIKSANENTLAVLNEEKDKIENITTDIKTKVTFLIQFTEISDLSNRQSMETEVGVILNDMKNPSKFLPLHPKFKTLKSPVTLKFSNCNSEQIVQVNVTNDCNVLTSNEVIPLELSATSSTSLVRTQNPIQNSLDFSRLPSYTYNQVKTIQTVGNVQRMRIINGNLYCASGKESINVYNTDCALIKTIKTNMHGVSSVAHYNVPLVYDIHSDYNVHSDQLIMACGFNGKGLYHMTTRGDCIICIWLSGHFSDVCSQGRRVYALEYNESKIKVFEKKSRDQKNWSNIECDEIKLNHKGHRFDKMTMRNNSIFVSSTNKNCIYAYNINTKACCEQLGTPRDGDNERSFVGKMRTRFLGAPGPPRPGELTHPTICCLDTHGNAIICDNWNRRIQVYCCEYGDSSRKEDRGEWRCLTIPRFDEHGPVDVAVGGDDGCTLWVVSHGYPNGAITKYSASESEI